MMAAIGNWQTERPICSLRSERICEAEYFRTLFSHNISSSSITHSRNEQIRALDLIHGSLRETGDVAGMQEDDYVRVEVRDELPAVSAAYWGSVKFTSIVVATSTGSPLSRVGW